MISLFDLPDYSSYGCETLWKHGQNHVTCSCDHLTYFGVLMVGLAFFIIKRNYTERIPTKQPVYQDCVFSTSEYETESALHSKMSKK